MFSQNRDLRYTNGVRCYSVERIAVVSHAPGVGRAARAAPSTACTGFGKPEVAGDRPGASVRTQRSGRPLCRSSGVSRDHDARAQTSAPILRRGARRRTRRYGHFAGALRRLQRLGVRHSHHARCPRGAGRRGTRGRARGVLGALARTLTVRSGGEVRKVLATLRAGRRGGNASARETRTWGGWLRYARSARHARVSLAIVSRASFEPGFKARAATRAASRVTARRETRSRSEVALHRRDAARLVSEKTFFSARRALASRPRASLTVLFPSLRARQTDRLGAAPSLARVGSLARVSARTGTRPADDSPTSVFPGLGDAAPRRRTFDITESLAGRSGRRA